MKKERFRKVDLVSASQVSRTWDKLAAIRFDDIASGKDRSYTEVLLPLVEDFSKRSAGGKLLDVGCGVGFASRVASSYFETVDAIDPSPVSISIAKRENFADNINYQTSSIEEFRPEGSQYDSLISSMVLMDCVDHDEFLRSCCRAVKPGSQMVFTLCHPFFWPRYWGFEKYSWFSYNSESAIESNFRTSTTGISSETTIYFHRPISAYLNSLLSAGASIKSIREISGISVRSRVLNKFPRYMVIEAVKAKC